MGRIGQVLLPYLSRPTLKTALTLSRPRHHALSYALLLGLSDPLLDQRFEYHQHHCGPDNADCQSARVPRKIVSWHSYRYCKYSVGHISLCFCLFLALPFWVAADHTVPKYD